MHIPRAASGLGLAGNHVAPFDNPSTNAPSSNWSSLIGVITAICGNILISFALNTQRYAHMRLSRDRDQEQQEKRRRDRRKARQSTSYGTAQSEVAKDRARENAKAEPAEYTLEDDSGRNGEEQPLIPRLDGHERRASDDTDETVRPQSQEKEKSYLKSPIWWLGISLMVVGEAGNFLAYGFAPASIVSPLGVVALVSNCLIAPLLLGEKFRWRDGLGVLIAIAGCVVVVLSASESNPKLDPKAIWHLITRWEFETYFGITAFLIIALTAASNKFGDKSILIDLGLVGLYGGYTALSTKGVASLLSNTIWRTLTFPVTYLLVAVLVFTAVMQIKYVNRALQRFNATMVIPTQFVLFTLSVIIGSAVLYRDFEREQTDDAIKFVAGCLLTFFGVWCITSGRGSDSSDEDEMDEEEDAISLIDEENVMPDIHGDDETATRRQSAVSASSSSQRPEMRLNRAESASQVLLARPGNMSTSSTRAQPNLEESLAGMPPALASAVHLDSTATLNPTHSESDSQKPPLHATTSAPVVPTTPKLQTSSLRPKTPLNRMPSGSAMQSPSRPSPSRGWTTTAGSTTQQHLDPSSSQQRLLQARNSVVGLLPGPLTSPLSGSLSAIVADELRRGLADGNGSVRRKSFRRGVSRQDLSKPIFPTGLKRHSIASGEMEFDREDGVAEGSGAVEGLAQSGRMRSLSATLGDLFGSTRRVARGGRREENGDDALAPDEEEFGQSERSQR